MPDSKNYARPKPNPKILVERNFPQDQKDVKQEHVLLGKITIQENKDFLKKKLVIINLHQYTTVDVFIVMNAC